MKKILILVEGQTEESFVKNILNPGLSSNNLYVVPIIITTKKVKNGPNFKGGVNSYTTIKKEVQKLLRDSSAVAITTMIDFYKIPNDFPSWSSNGTCYDKVVAAECAFRDDINQSRFIPYLQLHEFEGLLFSVPEVISDALDRKKKQEVQSIRTAFATPEEINNGEQTHPSMRLISLFPYYKKPIFGSIIAGRIGIDQIKAACPHFNSWFVSLQSL